MVTDAQIKLFAIEFVTLLQPLLMQMTTPPSPNAQQPPGRRRP